jgi:hypothetical protein
VINEIEKRLWDKTDRYMPIVYRYCPFLRGISVCNNLAFSKVNENSDIDLFIITKNDRMFTARVFITLILQFLNVRRYSDKIAGRFCLSFFIDDSRLSLKDLAIFHDVYLAYWVKSMKVFADDNVFIGFFDKNLWIRDYFDEDTNISNNYVRSREIAKSIFRIVFEYLLSGYLGLLLEKILKKWQIARANKKSFKLADRSGIVINEHMLKFHNFDKRKLYRQKWEDLYGKSEKIVDEKFLRINI